MSSIYVNLLLISKCWFYTLHPANAQTIRTNELKSWSETTFNSHFFAFVHWPLICSFHFISFFFFSSIKIFCEYNLQCLFQVVNFSHPMQLTECETIYLNLITFFIIHFSLVRLFKWIQFRVKMGIVFFFAVLHLFLLEIK